MKIEKVKLVDLKPAERNVRMHPPEQINEYKRSLEKFGQTKAIVIDEKNNILIGNGLFIAISQLGWKEADCYRKTGLSENDKKKLMLADNRIFDLGSDDLNVFDQLIRELDGDFDIPGYTDDLLNSLVMDAAETTEMLSEYGVVDGDEAETIRTATVNEQPAPSPAPVAASSTEAAPAQDTATTSTTSAEIENNRFVICPDCGAKIWL